LIKIKNKEVVPHDGTVQAYK